jgi:hypothetical protein
MGRTDRRRWFAGIGIVIAVVMMVVMLTSPVQVRQPGVAVSDWFECTDAEGVTWRNFVLTNAGPGGVEYDTRSYQWIDLPLGDPLSGAFVMGGSGSLEPGTAAVLTWMKPSRQDGQWRFVVACRRNLRPIERLRLHLHNRFPWFFEAPRLDREPWLATSSWTQIHDKNPAEPMQTNEP